MESLATSASLIYLQNALGSNVSYITQHIGDAT